MMVATPTTAECMRYGGGWGTCIASPKPPPTWETTTTAAPLRLWFKAAQWAYHNDHAGTQIVTEWDDIVSDGYAYLEPLGGTSAIGPQWIPDDGSGKSCIRFRGNAGEGMHLLNFDGGVLPVLRIAEDDGTIHAEDRVLTFAMVAKVPLGGTNGATIAGYYSPTQGAANVGSLQGYGIHSDPNDAYSNPPVFSAFPGVGGAGHYVSSQPTSLRGGTRVLYLFDVVFQRYGSPGDYHVSVNLEYMTAPGVYGSGPASGGFNPWSAYTGMHGGIVYPTSGGNFFVGGPGRNGSLFATADLYEMWLWEGGLTSFERGLLTSYVQRDYG